MQQVSETSIHYPTRWFMMMLGLWLYVALGCSEDTAIRSYQVAKRDTARPAPPVLATQESQQEQQILGAIVPDADAAWFFKFKDAPNKIEKHGQEFRQIVESVEFSASGEPKWSLGEGWTEQPPQDAFTYKRLVKDGDGVEATVSRLGAPPLEDSGAWQDYVLANVNRWRRQLALGEQGWEAMEPELQESSSLSKGTAKAYFVSLVGTGSGTMSPPFAGQASMPPMPSNPSPTAPVNALTYTAPDTWKELDVSGSQMRRAAFSIAEGERTAEATIIAAGGSIEANLGMWFGQVGLEATPELQADVLKAAEQVSVNGQDVLVYYLDGTETEGKQAIAVAVVLWKENESLFVKLKGDASLVQESREAFKDFVKSLKW